MSPLQARLNVDTTPFVLYTFPGSREDAAVLLQDAGRAAPLLKNTLMAQIVASGKWVPFTDETLTTGAGLPSGIYVGDDIAAATIVAGDVVDLPIIVEGIKFDQNKLVIENSKTLATVLNTGTVEARTVESELRSRTLIPQDTVDVSRYENA